MDSSGANQILLPLAAAKAAAATSSNSILKRKAKDEENLDVIPAKRVCFNGPNYRPQNFSFPETIIYYILKNPSSAKVWEKLIKSCKYFFAKNSVAVIFPTLDYYYGGWKSYGTSTCLDLMKITHKIWIADQIDISIIDADFDIFENLISSIIPKLYKSDAKYISLQCQILFYQDFLMIAKNVEEILLENVTVKYEDDTVVPIEKLVEPLSKVKYFNFNGYLRAMMTYQSFSELQKLSHFSSIENFTLSNIPPTFDIEAFCSYMKTNKHTKFNLFFCHGPQEYQNRLEDLVDEIIIGIAEHNYPNTLLCFNELGEENYEKMRSIYYGN